MTIRQSGARLGASLLVALFAVGALWGNGDGFPGGNNYYHLPIVLDYAGSVEGPHDTFYQSLDKFVSLFWTAVAAITTEQNVRTLFLLLLIAVTALTLVGALTLARSAGAGGWLAACALGLLSFGFASREFMEVGGGELLAGFLTHSQVATVIALFSLALAVRGRWIAAALLAGIAADANLFLGFWLMVTLAAARLLLDYPLGAKALIRPLLAMGAACLATAAPVLIWTLGLPGSFEDAGFSFSEFLYIYHPYHFFVHLELWLFLAALGLAVALAITQRAVAAESTPLRILALLAFAGVLAPGLGSAVLYLTDSRLLLNLAPLRYLAVAHWTVAAGAVVLWVGAERRQPSRAAFGATAVLGFLLATPPVSIVGLALLPERNQLTGRQKTLLLAGLLLALLAPCLSSGREIFPETTYVLPVPAFMLIGIVGATLIALRASGSILERVAPAALVWLAACSTAMGERALMPVAAVAITLLAAAILFGWRRPAVVALAAAAAALTLTLDAVLAREGLRLFAVTTAGSIAGVLAALLVTARLPRLPALPGNRIAIAALAGVLAVFGFRASARTAFDFPSWPKDDDWHAVQAWSRANTPPDTLFFSPDRVGFSTLARRPTWWDQNDGPAVMWQPSFFHHWNPRRLRAAEADTVDEVVQLAAAEQIRYLVLERGRIDGRDTAGLQVRYCNDSYCVGEVIATRGPVAAAVSPPVPGS